MSTLNELKLVVSKKQLHTPPIIIRRNKLITKLHEQLALCEAKRDGKIYAPIRLKTFTNKTTGERITREVAKRIKEWFWIGNDNKINLVIKYGAKTLTLNKKTKANAIELANSEELISTLKSLKLAVANGELDEAIAEVSEATRLAFGK